jgi:hypothetical protein
VTGVLTTVEAVIGLAVLGYGSALLYRVFSRVHTRREIHLDPWIATALTVVCGLMSSSLMLGAVGLADQPAAYDGMFTVVTIGLAVLAEAGPFHRGDGSEPRPHAEVRLRMLTPALLPLLIAAVALGIGWRSDNARSRPVTALAATRTAAGIEITVTRGSGDHQPLTVLVLAGGRQIWQSGTLPATGTANLVAGGADAQSGTVSVQLVSGTRVVRTVSTG